jgi:hypothetical protein
MCRTFLHEVALLMGSDARQTALNVLPMNGLPKHFWLGDTLKLLSVFLIQGRAVSTNFSLRHFIVRQRGTYQDPHTGAILLNWLQWVMSHASSTRPP